MVRGEEKVEENDANEGVSGKNLCVNNGAEKKKIEPVRACE